MVAAVAIAEFSACASRQAPNTLDVELENADGSRIKIKTTLNHPFHLEQWDGKVETMVANLNGNTAYDASRSFPSDEKTQFGDWVKAGALKTGDKVSTLGSVPDAVANDNGAPATGLPVKGGAENNFGPRIIASNDNTPLTITDIVRDNAASRVYNFEVASHDGEITHNYFVGDENAWVHNAGTPRVSPRILRKAWEERTGEQWPTDPATGWNQDACHILALADGGTNCACNIKPMTRANHIAEHVANGDFARWGRWALGR